MWSLAQRVGVTVLQNIQAVKSVPVTSVLPRLFSGLSRLPNATTSPSFGVTGVINTAPSQLLTPTFSPLVQLANGFKIKGRLKRRCKDCYFVVRQERRYVMCKSHGRHKQMAMKKSEKNSWILTDATQSKVRPW